MTKRSRFLSVLLIIFLLNSFVYAQAASNQKNFIWQVRSKTAVAYVIGSIHFLKKDAYPLNRKIEDAFDKADILAVEADVNKIDPADAQKLMETAIYLGDDDLEKHVSAETFELVEKEAQGLGIPVEILNRQRPWFLALTLESLELMKLGFDPNYGIDKYFLTKAAGKKRITELESLSYQINLFSGFSDKDQELLLLYTIKDSNSMEQELDRLMSAWTSGDAKTVESIMIKSVSEDKRLASIYEKLIYERNRNMAEKIEGYTKTGDTYFVVVGAGHLVGSKGIIELLKAKGFSVEQM